MNIEEYLTFILCSMMGSFLGALVTCEVIGDFKSYAKDMRAYFIDFEKQVNEVKRTLRQRALSRCVWTLKGDGVYESSCGHTQFFEEDSPLESGYLVCPFCTGKIIELNKGAKT